MAEFFLILILEEKASRNVRGNSLIIYVDKKKRKEKVQG